MPFLSQSSIALAAGCFGTGFSRCAARTWGRRFRRLFGRAWCSPAFLVIHVKTWTFENHSQTPVNAAAYFHAALRTNLYRSIVNALKRVKNMAAACAFIFISRHI
jgi:hypothetical protein